MFQVTVESDKLLMQFDDMRQRVLDMGTHQLPQVFLEWQREDMNRKYPKIDEASGNPGGTLSVTTLIYPRSRRVRVRSGNSGRSTTKKPPRRRVAGSHRPILRPVLVDQLFKRMVDMCREAIEWR